MTGKRALKIAFLTHNDAKDRRSYSGTHYYMGEALERNGFEVTFIGPLKPWEEFIGKALNKLSQLFLRKKFRYLHTPYLAKRYARIAKRKMKNKEFDFIYAPAASKEIAYLDTTIPIVYTSDTTWILLNDYYSKFSDMLPLSVRQGDLLERKAIQNASVMPFPSQWVANSAIHDYGAKESAVEIISWGANMDTIPARETALSRKRSDECRLFFLGVHWQRKGGELACQTLLELEKLGINAHLTICGCEPPEPIGHPRITVIPFLSKKDPAQRKQLEELFLTSDFLLLPTRAECYGIVFCEAASYGLPVIATDTGGVSSIVKEGVNGYLLPHTAPASEYAQVIKRVYEDEALYARLVQTARQRYDEVINWDTWAQKLEQRLIAYQNSGK